MPELEPEELEPPELDDPELLELVAGGDEDVGLNEDDPPPQPATNIAISTSVANKAAGRRGEPNKAFMSYLSMAAQRAHAAIAVLATGAVAIAIGSLVALFISESGGLFGFTEHGYRAAIII